MTKNSLQPKNGSAVVACYESISQATTRMLKAAQEQNWTAVSAEEDRCAQLVQELQRSGGAWEGLTPEHARRKAEIIRKVLAQEAQIRVLSKPRLEELERLLGSSRNKRRLASIYRP